MVAAAADDREKVVVEPAQLCCRGSHFVQDNKEGQRRHSPVVVETPFLKFLASRISASPPPLPGGVLVGNWI